ncbi:hypothetical protein AYO39_00205 [Actinobacteria bacterium SCGC AG-212-D09]|nr:hypothetical protein AYO39_00205 [Actinobacteria bacterium SCGC AG-212-D09]
MHALTVSGRSRACSRPSAAGARPATRPGNSPGTKWVAFNAIAEHLDYGRRYPSRTNQAQRSLEVAALKQRALDVVLAA